MVRGRPRKMTGLRRALLWVVGVMLLGLAVVYSLPDEGLHIVWEPCTGVPVAIPEHAASTSSVRAGAFLVECYTPPGGPPIIATRRYDGAVIGAWAIVPDRWPDVAVCDAEVIRSKRRGNGYTVYGDATGTYGDSPFVNQSAVFRFDPEGGLSWFQMRCPL